ncbi:MAG TPA: hypothetical protein VNC50_03510, partial [Planctomycetia bacterium]|nr:hypothetical protein [Planctomycetia bacterium]
CGLDAAGEAPDWNDHSRTLQPQWDRFDDLAPADRQSLFEVLYGRMAGPVADVLEALKSAPYQLHDGRRPFRAPADLKATRSRRIDFANAWTHLTEGKDQGLEWYAAYAPYMWRNHIIGTTCAAMIDRGGKESAAIKDLLIASATNEHEIGAMGSHVCTGLLGCSDSAAWDFMEKLLLAAQRQEGLRTVILETVDSAHPVAFQRMLRVMLENDLHRFSAVTRALDVWLGYLLDSQSQGTVKKILERVLLYFENPGARASAIKNEEPWAAYEALWATACSDANDAIKLATPLLADKSVERRYVGAKLLDELDLASAHAALWSAIDDPDLRIFAVAGEAATEHAAHLPKGADGFAAVAARLGSLPKERTTLPALVWPWGESKFGREDALRWLARMDLDGRPASAYAPYLKEFDSYDRQRIVEKLAKAETWDDAIRAALLDVLNYSGAGDIAAEEMAKRPVRLEDAIVLEALLSRKGEALRRRIFAVLASQKDGEAIASAKRLISAKSRDERLGGLELLRQLKSANREVAACAALAKAYRAERKSLASEEENQLAAIEEEESAAAATDATFFNPNALSKPLVPQARKGKPALERLAKIIKSLDEFIARHKEAEFETTSGEKQLLGSEPYGFPSPEWDEPIESQLEKL